MNYKKYPLCLGALSALAVSVCAQTAPTTPAPAATAPAAAAPAAPAAAPTSPVSTPAMEGPLAVNLKPLSFDVPDFGKIYVSGAVSGIALLENNPFPGDRKDLADVSNAQVFIQKVDGEFQFFLDAGTYALPTLGAAYLTSGNATTDLYGPLSTAFVKIVPNSTFSIEAGKLPTLIGAEYLFSYENMNIVRGELWNQEPAISRGVQANYTAGPVALAASWNDGFYSDRFNWISASATWTINSSNTLAFVFGGNLGNTPYSNSLAVPVVQNNDSQIENIIYTYTQGAWLINPYIQYASSKAEPLAGYNKSANQTGFGILANYAVPNTSFNLAGRFEYLTTSGSPTDGTPNLLYGPGSKAWTATFTPTYQSGVFFTRAEASVIQASSVVHGMGLGASGANTYQFRLAVETGILF